MSVPVQLNGKYYGVKEAADALDRTEGRVRQMIRWGHIEHVKISDRVWLIPERAIKQALRDRGQVAAS